MKKNEELLLECIDVTYDAFGVCKEGSFTVYVKDLLIGEVALVKILSVKKNHAFGKVLELKQASEYRIVPLCSVNGKCGGCQYGHIRYEYQLILKKKRVQDCFRTIGKMDVEVKDVIGMEEPYKYRNKVQVPLQYEDELRMGFYRNHSNDIVSFDYCMVQSDLSNAIIQYLKELLKGCKESKKIKHILIKHGFTTNEIMLVFIVKEEIHLKEIVEDVTRKFKEIKSVILNINSRKDNVIMGEEEKLLWNQDYIIDELDGLKFKISSKSFYQINPIQTVKLYRQAIKQCNVSDADICVDLYCGTGTIGMFLALKAKYVYGIEIVEDAVKDAKYNAKMNGIENIEFLCGDAGVVSKELLKKDKIDIVVVDPPRKGLSKEAIDTVVAMKPKKVVYVSCDPSTLARDCKVFEELNYKVEDVQPVDMFPFTSHVETIVLLSKLDSKKYISVELPMDDMDLTSAESKVTYKQIQNYVLEKFGFKVSTLYIAQVKKKHGLEAREHYNISKNDNRRVPQCSIEKEEAILNALRNFNMLFLI